MRLFLVLSLVLAPILSGSGVTRLDAKNPGCDPEIHLCSDDISG